MEFLDNEAREEEPQTQPMPVSSSEEEEEPPRPRLKRSHRILDEEEEAEEAAAYLAFLKERKEKEAKALADCPPLTTADYTENAKGKAASTLIISSPKKKRRIQLDTIEVSKTFFLSFFLSFQRKKKEKNILNVGDFAQHPFIETLSKLFNIYYIKSAKQA